MANFMNIYTLACLFVCLYVQLHYHKQGKHDEFVRLLESSRTGNTHYIIIEWEEELALNSRNFCLHKFTFIRIARILSNFNFSK